MPSTTTKLQLPYPLAADTVDVPRDVQALANKLDTTIGGFRTGTYATRPAANTVTAGSYYAATGTAGGLWVSDGTKWSTVDPPVFAVPPLPTVGVQANDIIRFHPSGAEYSWDFVWQETGFANGWLSLGGNVPIVGRADTLRSITSTAYVDVPTDPITLTLPLAGVYDVTINGLQWFAGTALGQQGYYGYSMTGVAASDAWSSNIGQATALQSCSAMTTRQTMTNAATVVTERARVSTSGSSLSVANRRLIAAPVRVH